jgi:hypothetical protein
VETDRGGDSYASSGVSVNALYFEIGKTTRVLPVNTPAFIARRVPGECYKNSLYLMEYAGDRSMLYVEGFAFFHLPDGGLNLYHHGWNEKDGEIIETYPDAVITSYWPTRHYAYDEAMLMLKHRPRLPVYWSSKIFDFAAEWYHFKLQQTDSVKWEEWKKTRDELMKLYRKAGLRR